MKKNEIPFERFDLMEYDKRIMRLGLGLHLFFPRPFRDVREDIFELWKAYLSLIGKDLFTWARLGGGNKSRKVTPSTYKTIEQWLTGKKEYGDVCWITISDGDFDELGSHSFDLTGYEDPQDEEYDTESCHLEAVIPVDSLDKLDAIAIAEAFIKMVEPVPYKCGVFGFLFHRSPHKFYKTIGKMRALSKRFEAVEISANERLCYSATEGVITVNWVTFIGNEFLRRLGTVENISSQLPPSCDITVQRNGIAIRTGNYPPLGDKNAQKDDLIDLRKVYSVVQPVQYVDPEDEFDPDTFDSEETANWLRRFEQ
jgi:hypothetical protein